MEIFQLNVIIIPALSAAVETFSSSSPDSELKQQLTFKVSALRVIKILLWYITVNKERLNCNGTYSDNNLSYF